MGEVKLVDEFVGGKEFRRWCKETLECGSYWKRKKKKKKNHTLVNKFEKVLYPTLKLADP